MRTLEELKNEFWYLGEMRSVKDQESLELFDKACIEWLVRRSIIHTCPIENCGKIATESRYFPHPELGSADVDVCREHSNLGYETWQEAEKSE
jgi:hypothetical protein